MQKFMLKFPKNRELRACLGISFLLITIIVNFVLKLGKNLCES